MLDGLTHGHQDRFYKTVDQQVLGDERFLEAVNCRTTATPDVAVRPRRAAFGALLTAIAHAYRLSPRAMFAPGRQRALVQPRAMLVYFAREWSHLSVRELSRRVQRDPAMVSRLTARYMAQRDTQAEARMQQALGCLTHQASLALADALSAPDGLTTGPFKAYTVSPLGLNGEPPYWLGRNRSLEKGTKHP